ncbi:ribosomal large subunit pseudouridine synthase B [Melioribacter roseus P3M-2]|uniref:Pseudouridine synthase n=1 Tax=Melioribacter roseus (strain DSM 23840 / JCM 17771 / VKM B-2668 / P3M-2) TaxID=1191523 RepID=I7A7C2_MELRP|nr:ribosomal large subunit pseudouridine synthase B [Melioribacter roseus P3M-2]
MNKFLSECGISSRRNSEEYIKTGRVSVNGNIVTDFSFYVDPAVDVVYLDGEKLKPEKKVYYLLNKPKGYITTTSDEKNRKKVTDLIKTKHKIFPVGRLDYNTTGVLILTNDGNFSNLMTHPSKKIPRVYRATLDKPLIQEHADKLSKGIYLDGRKSKFEEIKYVNSNNKKMVEVTTVEGRNHFVKRMFGQLGYFVKSLERVSFGIFTLEKLPYGYYREITDKEIEKVYKLYDK